MHYQCLGQKVANLKGRNIQGFSKEYITELMLAFKKVATRRRQTNVLQHCMGYLKRNLNGHDKQELSDIIEQYRLGLIPLIVPITLLQHYFKHHPNQYILNQTYLNPYPKEFMLRNMI
ncbi:unnamed protein product [marine sediment metagenome]|uniref:DUF1722 domain-containing protein n=1 Tax=marine sediment metagenome TaxID=412755 RepID=X1BWB3_9ZZZZ